MDSQQHEQKGKKKRSRLRHKSKGSRASRSLFSRIPTIDRYIIRLFLGTFIGAISLILAVSVIFDINERIDKFLNPDCTLYEIVFHYYLNFIPYYGNMFAPLFVFVSVIFFTTKLAQNSEIIAILSGGFSFNRLLRPYFISATVIAVATLLLNSFVIPPGNKVRNDFYTKYIKDKTVQYASTIQLELSEGEYLYIRYFSAESNRGYDLSIDNFREGTLVSRLVASSASYINDYNWNLEEYTLTRYGTQQDSVSRGTSLDTIIGIKPSDFLVAAIDAENLTTPALIAQIGKQNKRGASNVKLFEVELHKRFASFFAAYILTLIGVSLSSRKYRGGMGFSLAIGIALSFTYILFMTVSSSFAISGVMPPWLAAQLPNIVYAGIAFFLYLRAPR